MMDLLWVGIGGFAGAICRYGAVEGIGKRFPSALPAGTLFVNALGSFLLGLLYGLSANLQMTLLLGTGFMGAFTTFSTFQYELVQFGRLQKWKHLVRYVLLSVAIGMVLVSLGYGLGRWIH
ncbi:fluoride efflux transporter FluC [Paenibacillus caui]|uniref:fluoride efflux transporter FluC n=1 Tax=Paenibacillus caui TaxID=2873927 RepID=UPI001CA90051|nr:CrcB family protein [Paenibacillus caui]